MDKKLIRKIQRQWTLKEEKRKEIKAYDDIFDCKWDGIPQLKDKVWYVEYKDTTGRDLIQQAVNMFATHKPKWDVLPRGPNDKDAAEEMERVVEWYFLRANEMNRKPPLAEAMTYASKHNVICGQIEWKNDYPCIVNYHSNTVVYEYGTEVQWYAIVNNVYAVDILEHWNSYSDDKKIQKALEKIQALVDEDEEQRMMYIDYADKDRRFTICYKATDERIDDTFGLNENDKMVGHIQIQDKANKYGFVNFVVSEGEGDALLAPLHKGDLWLNTNRSETIKRTIAYRSAFPVMFMEEGVGGDVEIDYSGDFPIAKIPPGKKLTQNQQIQLDPVFNELSAQDRQRMTAAAGLDQNTGLQAANVQFATINAIIQIRQSQMDPYKRAFEKYAKRMAVLLLKMMQHYKKPMVAYRKDNGVGDVSKLKGAQITVDLTDETIDAAFVECELLPNSPTDMMQRVNSFMTMRQGGAPISWKEIFERLHLGGEFSIEEFQKEAVSNGVLQAFLQRMQQAVQLEGEAQRMQMQMASQQAMMEAQGQQPPEQGVDQAAQQQAQGQGFNAAQGGSAPQLMSPSMTQTQGGEDVTGAGAG